VSDAGERIAVLEQRADDSQTDRKTDRDQLNAMAQDIHEIKEKLSNWRGFFSGVVFAMSMLAGLVGAAATWLWHKFST
jgi:F0F1-type ATP synthase assembly protein I